jgi:hypothetical protein
MERLTYRTELGVSIDKNEDCPTYSICWNCNIPPRECKYIDGVLKKLANYEDLEEQGRLIKLPCKVGDTVWDNDCGRPCAYTITAFSFGECEEYICEPVTTKEVVFYYANSSGSITGSFAESEIGKSVFLNRYEAEAKLKELRGEENE